MERLPNQIGVGFRFWSSRLCNPFIKKNWRSLIRAIYKWIYFYLSWRSASETQIFHSSYSISHIFSETIVDRCNLADIIEYMFLTVVTICYIESNIPFELQHLLYIFSKLPNDWKWWIVKSNSSLLWFCNFSLHYDNVSLHWFYDEALQTAATGIFFVRTRHWSRVNFLHAFNWWNA